VAWLKIDDNIPHHKKLLQAGPSAAWLWLCGVAYCQRHKTDGYIPGEALPWLGVEKPRPLASTLVRVGLWHEEPGGWRVHDFLEWNASADERADKSAAKDERQRKWREKQKAIAEAKKRASTPETVDASTSRLVDAAPTPAPTPQPTPAPQPAPPPSGEDGREAPASPAPPPGAVRTTVQTVPAPAVEVSSSELMMHPSQYQRLRKRNAYVGARLHVPHDKHAELVALRGGDNPEGELQAWYAELDEALVIHKAPIAPDVWRFLDRKFAEWHQPTAAAAELDAWAPGGKHDGGIQ